MLQEACKISSIQNWQAEVRRKKICTLYKSFKRDFAFQNYLVNLSKQQSLTLRKFRTSNHRWPVVLEEYTKAEMQKYRNAEMQKYT